MGLIVGFDVRWLNYRKKKKKFGQPWARRREQRLTLHNCSIINQFASGGLFYHIFLERLVSNSSESGYFLLLLPFYI